MKNRIYKFLKESKNFFRLTFLYFNDMMRFQKNYNLIEENATEDQLLSKFILHAHGLEKGLSHNNFRPEFGKEKLKKINKLLVEHKRKRFSKETNGYKILISSLKNYEHYHKEINYNLDFFYSIFSEDIIEEINKAKAEYSGITITKKEDKKNNKNLNFANLALNRHSIREFSPTEVSIEKINNAIDISLKTPSVCNRQPYLVYRITEKNKISRVLHFQEGFNGYETPPVLLAVTSSTKNFVSIFERNQPLIDGGLFSMSLIYSLEYEGLACCALNAMLPPKNEKEIRNVLKIPEDEIIIMFLAVGNVPEKVKSPKSYRKSRSEILIEE